MKIERLISIIMVLLDKERVGAQELANMFEVSQRTIYRDIEAINRAGIPVCSIPGVGGGFEIMQGYKLDKNVFSSTDLSVLWRGLFSLSGIMQKDELANALVKVKSFLPANKAEEIEKKARQVNIDVRSWMGNQNVEKSLEIIQMALEENKVLLFDYIDLHGNRTARSIEAYQLVLKSGHWYCQGYCYVREDFRLFRLSRMLDLVMSQQTFISREYPQPELDFPPILKSMQTTIKIRIHQSIMEEVLEYCGEENFLPDGDEYYLVDFPFIENEYYYNILLGFGTRCECLGPQHVREEVKQKILAMVALYNE